MSPTRTPHDLLFQFLFAQPRLAAAWARSILPAEAAAAIDADPGPPPPDDALTAISCYLADTTELSLEELDMTISRHIIRDIAYPGTAGERLRNEGFAAGHAEGLREGRSEGRDEGMATFLQRQLARRFGPLPPAIIARVQAAATSQLEQWCDRVLDAADLASVLGD